MKVSLETIRASNGLYQKTVQLGQEIEQKNILINSLQSQLANANNKDSEINSLKSQLAQKDSYINSLIQTNTSLSSTNSEEIKKKDLVIKSMQDNINKEKEANRVLLGECTELKQDKKDLRDSKNSLNGEVDALKEIITLKEQKYKQMEQEMTLLKKDFGGLSFSVINPENNAEIVEAEAVRPLFIDHPLSGYYDHTTHSVILNDGVIHSIDLTGNVNMSNVMSNDLDI